MLIWEVIVGERDESFNKVGTGSKHAVLEVHSKTHPLYNQMMAHYKRIESSVQNHSKLPSFLSGSPQKAQTIELIWDGTNYTAVLTDTNQVLSNYKFTCSDPNVSFSVTGNKLTVTAKKAPTSTLTISAVKSAQRKGVVTWTDTVYGPNGGIQDMITYAQTVSDPVQGFIKTKVSYGSAKIVKTSEDGNIANISFHITGNGVDQTVKTNSRGEIQIDNLLPGSYTVTEANYDKYVPQKSQTVEVKSGQVSTVTFNNSLKKFNVTVKKQDSETGETPQGQGSLEGAKYGLFKGEELVDTYVTDKNGEFVTDYYICASDWTIREIAPSEGYLLDETVYQVGAEPQKYEVEYNHINLGVTEQAIKGKLALIKHTDDGSTGIETPEAGAEFQIYYRDSGSYEESKESERDLLICDESGYAESKDLPYGWYTVHQIKGWDGREFIEDFDVFISENGNVYRYLLNNANFESRVKIVKKDAESGNIVPQAGHGYEIYSPDGEKIVMEMTYPEVIEIDTFYTDSNGYLITPEPLPYGEGYYIVEVETVEPYVLDPTPVYFDITPDSAEDQDHITVVTVEKANMPQKGIITVNKAGEVFSSVITSGGGDSPLLYQPEYSLAGLEGATFEVIAAEDIVSGGILRYVKGEVVSTLTTDEKGSATSDPLYLGTYQIFERKAPDGMVITSEPITVKLVYAGQHESITTSVISMENERQKAQISLDKILQQDSGFGVGSNGEILAVSFGLYADENLVASDGSMIPKDGLIEIIQCDENGKATFNTDIPMGSKLYVKEYSTDFHYILSDDRYPVIFEYQGQEVADVTIAVNNGDPIENRLIYGEIVGLKVDQSDKPLTGAVFGLFHTDCVEFVKENAVMTADSREDGSFRFTKVPYGKYLIREIESAEGYAVTDKIFEVTIQEDGEIINIGKVVNRPITGKLELIKTDIADGKPLPNAGFRIRNDAGEIVAEGYTNDEGVATFTLGYGSYSYEEFDAPDGYQIDTTPHKFSITKDGEIIKAQMTNEKIPIYPQTGDKGSPGFWAALSILSISGAVFTYLGLRRRKNNLSNRERKE